MNICSQSAARKGCRLPVNPVLKKCDSQANRADCYPKENHCLCKKVKRSDTILIIVQIGNARKRLEINHPRIIWYLIISQKTQKAICDFFGNKKTEAIASILLLVRETGLELRTNALCALRSFLAHLKVRTPQAEPKTSVAFSYPFSTIKKIRTPIGVLIFFGAGNGT